jgi:acetoacetate decarboxylase
MMGTAAEHDGEPVTYTPYYLLDSDSAIALGREVWGIPKNTA